MNKAVQFLLIIPVLSLVRPSFADSDPALSARHIMARALDRTQSLEVQNSRSQYRYTRLTTTTELDSKGKIREQKEKTHQVCLQSGQPRLLSARVNGNTLPSVELREEEKKETAARKNYLRSNSRNEQFEKILSSDLVARYDFELVGTEPCQGRPSFVLEFKPKPGLEIKHIADRLLNHLHGRIWIDTEEYELAKAEVGLQKEVKLIGGLLASIRDFQITLVRFRLEDGAWFNRLSTAYFDGRKLFDSVHVRVKTESTDFHKVRSG